MVCRATFEETSNVSANYCILFSERVKWKVTIKKRAAKKGQQDD